MFEIAGQVSRRRLVPRSPDAARLLADLTAWLATTYPDEARVADPAGAPPGAARIALHPAAREVVLEVADDGQVAIRGETAMVGPGYHRFLGRLVERLGAEFAGVRGWLVHTDRDLLVEAIAARAAESAVGSRVRQSATMSRMTSWIAPSTIRQARTLGAPDAGSASSSLSDTSTYSASG